MVTGTTRKYLLTSIIPYLFLPSKWAKYSVCPGNGKFAPSLRIDLLIGIVQIAEHFPFFKKWTPRSTAVIVASAFLGFGFPGTRCSGNLCRITVSEFLSMLDRLHMATGVSILVF